MRSLGVMRRLSAVSFKTHRDHAKEGIVMTSSSTSGSSMNFIVYKGSDQYFRESLAQGLQRAMCHNVCNYLGDDH